MLGVIDTNLVAGDIAHIVASVAFSPTHSWFYKMSPGCKDVGVVIFALYPYTQIHSLVVVINFYILI